MNEKLGPRSPNPVDVHVGARVRLRRKILKLSQEKLGEQLGVNLKAQLYCLKRQISLLSSMISSIRRMV